MRSRKAALNQAASILGTLAALAFAFLIAIGLGVATYMITSPEGAGYLQEALAANKTSSQVAPTSFILFMIFSFLYMVWATLPLSVGTGGQFDPGRLLMYPISLRRLFAIDLLSELTSLSSLFAVPAILAMAIGAGLATGFLWKALIAVIPIVLFGIALAKWLATSIGSLIKKRRTRGETILAMIGALAGLAGAFMGQLWPIVMRYAGQVRGLRWTPPGAAAMVLTHLGAADLAEYVIGLLVLSGYGVIIIWATYWIAKRAALGKGEAKRKQMQVATPSGIYTGWELPLISSDLSALIEKEVRYALRNAQLKTIALMPLILLAVRFMNTRRVGKTRGLPPEAVLKVNDFLFYAAPLLATGGVLYVFLILAGIACNEFAFEGGGMRTLILSPVERRKILIGKNLVIALVGFVYSSALLIANQLVFRDITPLTLLFVSLSFIVFAMLMSVTGNWFSIRFPRQMKFGKRMNVSGIAGLLLIPILIVMAVPPLTAVLAGYYSHSLLIEYVTLAVFAAMALLLYFPIIKVQGRSLERRERDVLEAVNKDAAG
jgi:hypothetical protein